MVSMFDLLCVVFVSLLSFLVFVVSFYYICCIVLLYLM